MIGLLDTPTSISNATLRAAILGCGNVGAEVARQLQLRAESLSLRVGRRLEIAGVLVRHVERERPVSGAVLTRSFEDILAARPDVIIELLGGIEPARSHIEAALRRGISVVTANKSVIARHGQALQRLARRHHAQLRYEAAVGAGVPILAALDQLRGDRITSIAGIVNGTCNFILDRIEKTRCTLGEALAEAQRLGFAEPDPSADVAGRDSAEKLCVLAQAAGWGWIDVNAVQTTGIESITPEDVQCARQQHCVIRLVAEAVRDANGVVSLRVGPTFVPRSHALAAASGCENAFEILAEHAGAIRLHGPGAGAKPTASAVISDLLAIAARFGPAHEIERRATHVDLHAASAVQRRHYIRLQAPASQLTPDRVLGELAAQGIAADTTALLCDRTVVHTLPIDSNRATLLAEALTGGAAHGCLVAPYVES